MTLVVVRIVYVREVMCAYQRLDDDPCCGSNRLLQQILRDEWGFKYLVVSDCGAVSDFYTSHKSSSSPITASAKATLAGTDVECGYGYAYKSIPEAVRRGLIVGRSFRPGRDGRSFVGGVVEDSLFCHVYQGISPAFAQYGATDYCVVAEQR